MQTPWPQQGIVPGSWFSWGLGFPNIGSSPGLSLCPETTSPHPFFLWRRLALRNTPLGEQDPLGETTAFGSVYGCKALEGLRTLTAR